MKHLLTIRPSAILCLLVYPMRIKLTFVLILVLCLQACMNDRIETVKESSQDLDPKVEEKSNQIEVLNLGTFHMGYTPDENSIEYDEGAKENAAQIKGICEKLARFKPTVICVELVPSAQSDIDSEYQKYLASPDSAKIYADTEIQLLGFSIAKQAEVKRIIGIDHHLDYEYDLSDFATEIGADGYFTVQNELVKRISLFDVGPTLESTLLKYNTKDAYNFLINYNADKLTFANSKDGFEGADEATKYYQRNLRMFSNFNKIDLNNGDRVLIITGASHAAFFNMFLARSSIYKLVDLEKYL